MYVLKEFHFCVLGIHCMAYCKFLVYLKAYSIGYILMMLFHILKIRFYSTESFTFLFLFFT